MLFPEGKRLVGALPYPLTSPLASSLQRPGHRVGERLPLTGQHSEEWGGGVGGGGNGASASDF